MFKRPTPLTTGVCRHCCMDPKIEADFLKRQPRELPADYIREWYFAAFAGDIGRAHIAWILPRVMEMLADGEVVATVGHQVVFQRLPLTGFPADWPEAEVAAVQSFAQAFFAALLADAVPNADPYIDSWLCMFGQGGVDIGPLLDLMEALPDDALAERLNRSWRFGHRGGITLDEFWDDGPAKRQAWAWYTSKSLMQRMERAAMAGNEKALKVHSVIAHARVCDGL